MRNIWTIAQREYRAFFATPSAYVVGAMILVVVGIIFASSINFAGQGSGFIPGIDIVTNTVVFMLVFTVPAITMRLISDETRSGTIELLLTSPLRDWEIVVGKWLGAYLFLLTIIAITIIYPLMLNNMVDPGIDQGLVMSNYLAMGLASGALIALGVMISSFFNNLVASFMMTMGSLVVLWFLMGIPIQFASGRMAKALRYIEFQGHFNAMSAGVINLVDIVYFISLVALFLMLGTVSLESRRWR